MKKFILAVCAAVAALFLVSCSGNPLPDGMDEAAVLQAGEAIVAELNDGQWQSVYDRLREDAQSATPSPDSIRDHVNAVLDEVGPFVSIEDSMATGQKLKDSGEEYATAVFYCKHEKDQAMYRIAFSADMELIGLQLTEQ